MNVDRVDFSIDFDDGFGGSVSGTSTSVFTVGPPDDYVYDRNRRWIPKSDDTPEKYLNFWESLTGPVYGPGLSSYRASGFQPSNARPEDLEAVGGSYGNYGVTHWIEWPLFDNDVFTATFPSVGFSIGSEYTNTRVLWRRAWEIEDKADNVPHPGFRYQVPCQCFIDTSLGNCRYPGVTFINFNPIAGPIPLYKLYDPVNEGCFAEIGGPAYQPEIDDPTDLGTIADGYQEVDFTFSLQFPSGKVYEIKPRVKSGLDSALNFVEPDPRFNSGDSFKAGGGAEYAPYNFSGWANAVLYKA